jgi:hypothetical protein
MKLVRSARTGKQDQDAGPASLNPGRIAIPLKPTRYGVVVKAYIPKCAITQMRHKCASIAAIIG